MARVPLHEGITTNTLHVQLPSGLSLPAATAEFSAFGKLARDIRIRSDGSAEIVYYDIRAAAWAHAGVRYPNTFARERLPPVPELASPPGLEDVGEPPPRATHKAILEDIPSTLLVENMFPVVLQQHGLEETVVSFELIKPAEQPQKPKKGKAKAGAAQALSFGTAIVFFSSEAAATRCRASFHGCTWGSETQPVRVTIQALPGAAPKAPQTVPSVETLSKAFTAHPITGVSRAAASAAKTFCPAAPHAVANVEDAAASAKQVGVTDPQALVPKVRKSSSETSTDAGEEVESSELDDHSLRQFEASPKSKFCAELNNLEGDLLKTLLGELQKVSGKAHTGAGAVSTTQYTALK